MRYLFLHPVFPGQLHSIIKYLAGQKDNQVIHCCQRSSLSDIPGVTKITYQVPPHPTTNTHPFVQRLEDAVYHGEALINTLNHQIFSYYSKKTP